MSRVIRALRSPKIASLYRSVITNLESKKCDENLKLLSRVCHSRAKKLADYEELSDTAKIATCLAIKHEIEHVSELHSLVVNSYTKTTINEKFPNWEFVMDSSSMEKTMGFYGQLWVNHETKQMVVVSAGTKVKFYEFKDSNIKNFFGFLHFLQDAISDFQVFMHKMPFQYKYGMEKFVDRLISDESLMASIKGYELFFTGHSLGGYLADGGALRAMKFKDNFSGIYSITMENPGTGIFMEQLLRNFKKHGYYPEDLKLEDIRNSFAVINNKPNWMNTASPQFGNLFLNEVEFTESDPSETSKFVPEFIRRIIHDATDHLSWHDCAYFEKLHRISPVEHNVWPVEMFSGFMSATGAEIGSFLLENAGLAPLFRFTGELTHKASTVLGSIKSLTYDKASATEESVREALGEVAIKLEEFLEPEMLVPLKGEAL